MQKSKSQPNKLSSFRAIELKSYFMSFQVFEFSSYSAGEDGFGLLEAMVSVFIMIAGVTGAMTLVSGGILNIGVAEDRLIAINLAQEGLEVVHNIRDTNWLFSPSHPWNDWNVDGVADDCSVGCAGYVLWDSVSLNTGSSYNDLRWNGADHYDASGASGETFSRAIKITDNPDGDGTTPDAKVETTIGWGQGDNCTVVSGVTRKYCVTLEERLYDWLD